LRGGSHSLDLFGGATLFEVFRYQPDWNRIGPHECWSRLSGLKLLRPHGVPEAFFAKLVSVADQFPSKAILALRAKILVQAIRNG
jgi:hypothetical protein